MMHKQLALLYAGRKRHDKLLSLASAWYFWETGHKIIPQWERRTSSFLIYFTKGESAISSLGSSFTSMVHQQKPLISPYLGIEPWKKRSTPCWGGIKKQKWKGIQMLVSFWSLGEGPKLWGDHSGHSLLWSYRSSLGIKDQTRSWEATFT